MKKVISLILIIAMFVFVGCSNDRQKTITDYDKVLQEMSEGITERLENQNDDVDSLSDREAKEYYANLVNYELDRLSKYKESVFEDEKINNLIHTYVNACETQLLAVDYYTNYELYSALWDGGRYTRSGIIVELYENYGLPITKEQAESYRPEVSYDVSVESDLDDLQEDIDALTTDDDVVLNVGDLTVVGCDGYFKDDDFEYSFVVKNNTKYKLDIGIVCSICDKKGNILATDNEYLHTSLPAGKEGTINGSVDKDELNGADYIVVDSFSYDGNGNHKVFELEAEKKNVEDNKIFIYN